jgi:hypothetical protein
MKEAAKFKNPKQPLKKASKGMMLKIIPPCVYPAYKPLLRLLK